MCHAISRERSCIECCSLKRELGFNARFEKEALSVAEFKVVMTEAIKRQRSGKAEMKQDYRENPKDESWV